MPTVLVLKHLFINLIRIVRAQAISFMQVTFANWFQVQRALRSWLANRTIDMDYNILDYVALALIACLPPTVYLGFVLSIYEVCFCIVRLNFKIPALSWVEQHSTSLIGLPKCILQVGFFVSGAMIASSSGKRFWTYVARWDWTVIDFHKFI